MTDTSDPLPHRDPRRDIPVTHDPDQIDPAALGVIDEFAARVRDILPHLLESAHAAAEQDDQAKALAILTTCLTRQEGLDRDAMTLLAAAALLEADERHRQHQDDLHHFIHCVYAGWGVWEVHYTRLGGGLIVQHPVATRWGHRWAQRYARNHSRKTGVPYGVPESSNTRWGGAR